MKKIILFRTIAIIIVLFNILNFFLMAASYTGINVKESATLFDHTFFNYTNIDGRWHIVGSASDNRLLPAIILLLLDLYLGFILSFRTPKYGDYLVMPYKRIFITCGIGIFLHLFLLMFAVSSSSYDEGYLNMIWKGMLWNTLWTIGYIVIIVLFAKIKRKKLTTNDEIKSRISVKDVIALSILIELFLSFFYVTLVKTFVYTVSRDGLSHTMRYGTLYFSQFMMMFKQENFYNLPGKVEGYPYMIIPLIIIFIQIITMIIKPKYRTIIVGVLSLINLVIMTIGLCDMCDSIYPNYISQNSRNFFSLVGAGYYFIILLNIALLCVNLYPETDSNIIIVGESEMEKIVNEEYLKNSEDKNNEEDNQVDKLDSDEVVKDKEEDFLETE